MASRVELVRLPEAPRLTSVVRSALTDFYFNSGRLVPANVVWGAGAILVLVVGLIWPLGALLLSPLLAFPTAGIFRVAARIVRDGADPARRDLPAASVAGARPTLLLGLASVAATIVLGSNLAIGLSGSEPMGWMIGTFAAWGLIVLWCGSIVAWPLIVDPLRANRPVSERLRLAGLLMLAHPVRFGALGALVAVIAVVSAILTVALLTIGLAFIALVACRHVYPVADGLEVHLAGARP